MRALAENPEMGRGAGLSVILEGLGPAVHVVLVSEA